MDFHSLPILANLTHHLTTRLHNSFTTNLHSLSTEHHRPAKTPSLSCGDNDDDDDGDDDDDNHNNNKKKNKENSRNQLLGKWVWLQSQL